jgi:lipoprotein-anchoring transpeptidase ErfK/SrfK
METACLPCRIVVYADLPIGVPLALYSKARMKLKGTSMRSSFVVGLVAAFLSNAAFAQSFFHTPSEPVEDTSTIVAQSQPAQGSFGGGFIEFLFGDSNAQRRQGPQQWYGPPPRQDYYREEENQQATYAPADRSEDRMDPRFMRREVMYDGREAPGTIVIDTPNHFLYLVESEGRAIRYGIGVGRPGFTWSGRHSVSAKKEWPDWIPPDEMIRRQPYLPHFVAGGPNNPLGARAMYLGSTMYRIHGSNEPWTIGQNVSSGCIRMRNADVIDLYERVKVGTKVVVL